MASVKTPAWNTHDEIPHAYPISSSTTGTVTTRLKLAPTLAYGHSVTHQAYRHIRWQKSEEQTLNPVLVLNAIKAKEKGAARFHSSAYWPWMIPPKQL